MKQINLRAVVLVQALLALCLPLYYILMVQLRLRSTVPLFAVIVLVLCFGRLKRRAEAADEYAKQAMQMADAACFKLSIVLMGVLVLPFLLLSGTPERLVGYLLTFGLFALILLRTRDGVSMLKTSLKEYRERHGMTQSGLAQRIGVRRETIVHLENGRYNPSLKLAMDIAKVFHVTVEELFTFTDE